MKRILKVLCLIFLISGSLVFFACSKDPVTLQKPISVDWANAGERDGETGEFITNKYILITDQNRFASGYEFFLTDSEDFENKENYIALPIVTKNFIDVTDKIDRQKQYHFYVRYIGSKNYRNSDYSEINVMEPETVQVDTPYLQMIDTKLYWFKIQNATGYKIYETVKDADENIVNSQEIAELDNNTTEFDFSQRLTSDGAPYLKFSYQIKALAEGNYKDSNKSLELENLIYIKEITLDKPKNLSINFETKELKFDSVKYATKYEIKVNRTGYEKIVTTSNNIVDLSACGVNFEKYDAYNFVVTAIESDVLKYSKSAESETLSEDYKTHFEAPTNITESQYGDRIVFGFDKVTLFVGEEEVEAQSYDLIITWNGGEKQFNLQRTSLDGTDKLSATLTIAEIFGTLSENMEISIKVKANAIDQYILDSEYSVAPDPTNPDAEKIIITKVTTEGEGE